jgi:hypothetical protein
MNVIYLASLVALTAGGACLWLVRRITSSRPTSRDLGAWIDVSWQNSRPIERLLDPTEFEFLRRRGLSKQRISELRSKRRQLFRMYLRRLTQEFNAIHSALRLAIVQSDTDRADLVRELGRQRFNFYRHLLGVEFRLALNAAGFETVPSLELIRPLEKLHIEFCNLVPSMSGAQA